MSITDLLPWKKPKNDALLRRSESELSVPDLREEMNRLFDEFFDRPFNFNSAFSDLANMGSFAPRADISETEKEITVSVELPGMNAEDIHISISHNVLTIQGEKKMEKEEKGKHYHRLERSYGSFQRSILLPADVDESKTEAAFKNGVLQVKLPKQSPSPETSRRITIKTG
ncbi:MAG TPA: Hsp20/alpha crystallin family protein [Anaerolineaceae bacterium]|nr:Hsp20/alpha crystallin family protein [Anaerolineaceae bacterium]HPN53162.1 Hsp20/alpha crystallin family protein [Anaerolineaceae bacterium]